jgi:hypothetical protein
MNRQRTIPQSTGKPTDILKIQKIKKIRVSFIFLLIVMKNTNCKLITSILILEISA